MIKTRLLVLPAAVIGLAIIAGRAPAAAAEPVIAFADELAAQGDYYRAITEYKRFLFSRTEDEETPFIRYKIALCYYMGERQETAALMFTDLKERCPKHEAGRNAALMLAQTHYSESKFGLASHELLEFVKMYPSDARAESAKMMAGVCFLRLENTEAAADILASIRPDSKLAANAQTLANEIPRFEDVRRKRPWLAGAMSAALPGAGQLYIERPRDALLSFLLNGALIFAAFQAFDRDEVVTGSLIAFVEVGWYFGNIYNAASGAHKFNRDRKNEFFGDMELEYGLNLFSRDSRHLCPSLGLNIRF